MVLNSLKLGLGFTVAVALICTALYLLGYAVGPTYSASDEQAEQDEPVLTGDGVVEHDHSDGVPLINPVRRLKQGTKLEDGCEFSSYLELRPGETMRESRTLAINWDTCEYIEEEGAVAPEHQEGLMEDDGLGDDEPTHHSNYMGPQMSNHNLVAKHKTGWYDPVNVYVNFLQTGVEYRYGAVNIFYKNHSCRPFHLQSSGWEDLGGSCSWAYSNVQKTVEVTQDRDFRNTVFPCPEGTGATVGYSYNKVGATVTGGPYGRESSRAEGDCAHLLGKRTRLYTNDDNGS